MMVAACGRVVPGASRWHHRPSRARRRGWRRAPVQAASSLVVATALALAPVAAAASEHPAGRSFRGDAPLALVRPAASAPLELTPETAALVESARLPDHVEASDVPDVLLAAVAAGVEVFHEVAAGEHLSALAALYGLEGEDGWRRLFDANPDIDDPNLVEAGTRLRIPGPDEELESRELPAVAVPVTRGGGASGAAGAAGGSVWDRLARCESGGNWGVNTGNGYYGGLQFSLRSWQAVGGTGYPHEHSRETQIAMGQRLQAIQGWGAWPACSRKLGLR